MFTKHLPKGTQVFWIDPEHKNSGVFELRGYNEEAAVLETDRSQCITEDQNSIYTEEYLDGWVSNFPEYRMMLNWDDLDLMTKGNRYEMYLVFNNKI